MAGATALAATLGMGSVTLLASPAQAAIDGVTISDTSVTEGGTLSFEVRVDPTAIDNPGGVSLTWATAGGTATTATDYTAVTDATAEVIAYNAAGNVRVINITVPTLQDALDEADETLTLTVTDAVGTTTVVGTGTIVDDDDAPSYTLTASPNPVAEAAGVAVVTATLSAVSGRTVTIPIDTANVTATAGADYTAIAAGSISIAPGLRTGSVAVAISDDTRDEDNETFTVTGSTDPDVTGTAAVTVTITDDEATPTISIAAPTTAVTEGTNLVFPVTLSTASGRTVTATVNTVNGTAMAPSDYTAITAATITFTAGNTVPDAPYAAGIPVATIDDNVNEADTENLSVTLSSPVGATLATSTATGVINDEPGGMPGFTVGDVTVNEGSGQATFTVTLTEPAATDAEFTIAENNDGTADPAIADADGPGDDDYTWPVDGNEKMTIAAGQTTGTLSVTINDDGVFEPTETVMADITVTGGVGGGPVTATATITDDDAYFVAITSASAAEGSAAEISAKVIGVSQENVALDFTVASGSVNGSNAAESTDFTIASRAFRTTIPSTTESGETVVVRAFAINNDRIHEPDETILVTATGPTGVNVNRGVITIKDTDAAPRLVVLDRSVSEAAGTVAVPVRLIYSGDTTSTEGWVRVSYSTANGTALSGSDYTGRSGSLTFYGGTTYLTIPVRVINDRRVERAERFTLRLGAVTPSRVVKADGIGTVTIWDNDTARR